MSKGRYERKKEKSKGGKVVLIILAVILVLVVAVGIAGVMYYNSILNKMNKVEVPKIEYTQPVTEMPTEVVETTEATTVPTETVHVPSSEDYVNILLVGQASRAGDVERMADTMILVTLNKYEKTITLTSFLRDTLVKMADFRGKHGGNIKLTTVYHLGSFYDNGNVAGSMELMNLTLYNNFGVEVDYNFEVDFEAFIKIVDMIGGLTVNLTQEEVDYLLADDRYVYYETLEPGWNCIDGMAALSYARMRKAAGDGESDIKRTSRQRAVIDSLFESIKGRSLSDIQELANTVLPYVTTSMSNTEITEMLLMILPMITELEIVNNGTCPVEGTYSGKMYDIYDDGFQHSVLTFNVAKQWRLMRAVTEGENAG